MMNNANEKNNILAVISLVLLSFSLGTCEFIIIGVLTDISKSLNISEIKAGGLVSIFALAYSICTPFSASIAGKFNRFHFIIFSCIFFIIGNLLCSIAHNYAILLFLRILLAIVSGLLISLSMSFSPYISNEEKRGAVIAWIFAGFSIASILGVPIGTNISYYFGWRASFIFIAAFSVITFILMFISLPRNTDSYKIKLLSQFVIFKDPRFILSTSSILLGAATPYVLYTYLKPILLNYLHIKDKNISIALLIFGISVLISNFISGKIAEKNGIYKLRFIFILEFILMITLPFSFNNHITSGISIIFIGFLMYSMNSPIQVNILNFTSKDYPSCLTLASSNIPFSFNFGIAFGSFIGSMIFKNFGLKWIGIGGAILAILAAISSILLDKINTKYNNK